jgi:nitrogen fixation/metabolism regulation signal transduction histidine kinase
MSEDFNPNSTDSMFARVLQRMDAQDKMLEEIRTQTTKTNGRVTALEQERWYQRGVIAAITCGVLMLWEAIKVAGKR